MTIVGKNITLILLFLTISNGWCQPAFVINESDEEIDLTGKIAYWEDKSAKTDFKKVIHNSDFRYHHSDNFSFGYSKSNFWLKTDFKYQGDTAREYYFMVLVPLIHKVDFYLVNENDSLIKHAVTGSEYPFEHREEENRYFIFRFEPKVGKTYRFFCMAHNDLGSLNVPLRLMSKEAFAKFYEIEGYVIFGFLGLLFLAFLVSLSLFINFQDKIYVFYCIYILSLFCLRVSQFGFSYKYFHPDHPDIAAISKVVFWITAAIGFINFVPLLLSSTKNYFKRAKRIFFIQTIFYCSILLYVILPYKFDMLNEILIYCVNFNYLISLMVVVSIAYKSFTKKFGPAFYFAIAICPIVIVVTYTLLSNFNIVPNNIITHYPVEIGATLEILFLFAALVNRYKIILQERYSLEFRLAEMEKQLQQSIPTSLNGNVTYTLKDVTEKYLNSKFSNEEVNAKHKELHAFMIEKKPYLDYEINLGKLSSNANINQHLISQIINQIENKNFFDYINSFRIEEAKKLLRDEKFYNYSVEGIGYECGFNTKATFYTTFKKFTGETPAEFRKNAARSQKHV